MSIMQNFACYYRTLGPKKQLAKNLLSRLGEFLVATELTKRGYLVDYVANLKLKTMIGCDLIASRGDASIIIQVKTKIGKEAHKRMRRSPEGWYTLKSQHQVGEPRSFNGWYAFVWLSEDTGNVDYYLAKAQDVFVIAEREFSSYLARHPSSKPVQPLMVHVSDIECYKDNWNFANECPGQKFEP